MKKVDLKSYLLILFIVVTVSACVGSGVSSRSPTSLPVEPVTYEPPKPEEWKIENGLTITFLQNKELPLVGGFLFIPGGGYWESPSKSGIVGALGAQMREGGAGERSPEKLDRELEKLAAEIGMQYSDEYGAANFFALNSDLEVVFSMFADMVRRPRFDETRLNLWKSNAIDSIRRRREDAGTVAQIALRSLVYGEKTVFGRVSTESDVRSISREDLMAAHKQFVQPEGAILAISGDVDRATVENLVQKYFGSWRQAGENLPTVPWVSHAAKPDIYYIDLPFQQAMIYMGHLGVRRFTPDFIAIDGFNQIFGAGGFSNRLVEQVRTNLGLAYVTYGVVSPRLIPGANTIGVQTKGESTGQAIVESLRVLKDMQDVPVSTEDLSSMQREIENSYVFNFDSPWAVIRRATLLKLLKYPEDYDVTYLNKLNALTAIDIQSVAKDRWDLSKFVIVVVGNEQALQSIRAVMAEKPELLQGYNLRQVKFDQKLESIS